MGSCQSHNSDEYKLFRVLLLEISLGNGQRVSRYTKLFFKQKCYFMEKTVEIETQTILQVCFGEGNGNPL